MGFNTPSQKFNLEDLVAQWAKAFEQFLLPAIKQVTGLDVSSPAALVSSIIHLIPNALDALVNIARFLGSTVEELLSGVFSWEVAIARFVVSRLLPGGVLGHGSPIPVGSLTSHQPNLFSAPAFGADSIESNPDWTIDPTSTRTSDGTGSAKVVADGTMKALRSGSVPVSVGQTFTATVYVNHEGYSGTGAPIQLQVVPFIGDTPGAPVALVTDSTAPGGTTAKVPVAYAPATPDLDWPGHELTGDYVVPEGVTAVQLRILITPEALAGVFRFDDANAAQTGKLRQEWIAGLPDALQDLISRWQILVDTIFNALTGGNGILNTIEDLAAALLAIPSAIIAGVGGPANIGESILAFINHLVGGLVGTPGTGASNADVFNIAQIISSRASQGANAWEVLSNRNNTPIDNGLLPSSEANYNLTVVNTTLDATQAASLIGVIRVQRSAPLGVVSWRGYGTTGLSAFYVDIWKINATTGVWTLAHHSPNIIGDLDPATTPIPWQFYFLDTPLARVQGEDYAYELVPVGGTHHVRGFSPTDDIPDHPYAQVVALAATRDNTSAPNSPPSTIVKASVVRSNNVPWIETAIDTGSASDQRDPITVYLTESTTVPIPNWANYIDRVALGAGGGARQGLTGGFFGEAGQPGKFNADTLQRGVDFDGTVAEVAFVRGDGGVGGPGTGAAGGSSTLTVGADALTAEGGAGGTDLKFGSAQIGRGPGQLDYNGEPYLGGGDQHATGSDGAAPGGAGTGGNGFGFQQGGDGAPGAGWVRFRQNPIDGESGLDTTPPTPPTAITLDAATPSSLTITITGGTD